MADKVQLAVPYKRFTVEESYDAIVIGSGIGGLANAALLAKHGGKKVLVLERHYTPGGFTHVFHRPGYEWDVGVHYIGDVKPGSALRAMFDDITDGKLAWADLGDPYDTIIIGDDQYPFPKGAKNLMAMLKARFPGEEQAIDTYFRYIKEALSGNLAFFGEKALPDLIGTVAGPFMRRKFLQWSDRTTLEVLESLTQNKRLIAVLSAQFGDYGLPPSQSSFVVHAMIAKHYFNGGFYPIGGSERFADTIIPVIERAGGKVLINADVAEVVLEKGRAVGVKMAADGKVIRAPYVISSTGVVNTFTKLIPRPVAEAEGYLAKLTQVTPSAAHLALYIGFKHTAEELKLPKSNLWIYPNDDHEGNIKKMTADPEAELPLVYVSFPAAKDPDFTNRHPGRATIDIITIAPPEWFAKWQDTKWKKRGAEYEAYKERLAQRLLSVLYKHVPQVKGQIDMYELSTPLTTQHFCNYEKGEIYGIDHTPQRFRQKWLKPKTSIPGFYLTGQDVVTCGIGGALFGGVLTASAILKANIIMTIMKDARKHHAPAAEPTPA